MQAASRLKNATYLRESGLCGNQLDQALLHFSNPFANFQIPRMPHISNMRVKAGKQLFGQSNPFLGGQQSGLQGQI